MPWYAKPSGTYTFSTPEGRANVAEINGFLNGLGYDLRAQAGMIGNIMAESGLNPWLWERNEVLPQRGYGLFQFTPSTSYLNGCVNNVGYAPNTSVTTIQPTAHPEDGYSQMTAVTTDQLNKWVSSCWRSYWQISDYPNLYNLRTRVLTNYGSGGTLSLQQFSQIDDLECATFAFLACYEGPNVPNQNARYQNAQIALNMLDPTIPPSPPPVYHAPSMPLWMMLRRL